MITYNEINETNKGILTDLLSKKEAIDSLLADTQTERAGADVIRAQKEQKLHAESNRLTEEMRKLRTATMV